MSNFVSFWPTFVLLIFHSLQSICVITLNAVALAVHDGSVHLILGNLNCVTFSLSLFLHAVKTSLLLVVDAHTKF